MKYTKLHDVGHGYKWQHLPPAWWVDRWPLPGLDEGGAVITTHVHARHHSRQHSCHR
jgi:hypothetical protein